MRLVAIGTACFLGAVLSPLPASADILYRHDHLLFAVPTADIRSWTTDDVAWTYAGSPAVPPQRFLADGDDAPVPPPGFERTVTTGYSREAIRATLRTRISDRFDRPAGNVVIGMTASGTVTFDGVGLPGRKADLDALVTLTIAALEHGVNDVSIPTVETQPAIRVDAQELRDMGIADVVTVGESIYAGSPVNRRHNIATGLARFNGHIIPRGETFSFTSTLGRVDGSTGYRKELVIKGDRTEPDYGGGLCQVSSTAYRGVWEYGFPILQRTNHSYAVSYYGPQGTDATVYQPNPDMQFRNDSPGALLIQTHHDENDRAYFIYYGTKDGRTSDVYGPFVWNRTDPPPDRTLETAELPPGVKKKVGDRHPGMSAAWVRRTAMPDGTQREETTVSIYQARPLFYEIGVASPSVRDDEPSPAPSIDEPPSWIGT